MTEKGTIKQTLLGGLTVGLLLLLFSLSGCGNTKSQQEDKNQQSQSAETETKKINFSEEKYEEKIVDNRIAIAEYPNHYEQEIQEIQNLSYPNIHFTEDCTVDPFPEELSRLSVFHTTEHGMSVQEGVETLENWLVSIGKRDDIKYRKKSGVECLCRYDFGDGILYEKYLRAQVFPIWGSYLYLAGSCVGLMIGCMFAAKKYQAGM